MVQFANVSYIVKNRNVISAVIPNVCTAVGPLNDQTFPLKPELCVKCGWSATPPESVWNVWKLGFLGVIIFIQVNVVWISWSELPSHFASWMSFCFCLTDKLRFTKVQFHRVSLVLPLLLCCRTMAALLPRGSDVTVKSWTVVNPRASGPAALS